ncbi:TBC1 domain family member 31 [Striga asiatica]|uniref:TBC1 domain family member 31 n=1 Tax=Striga asiatica TaxID=4170 RepID=A0A5A7QQL0_STRAF|nr:TBC1 domain family member 31 [Striga asiatica]
MVAPSAGVQNMFSPLPLITVIDSRFRRVESFSHLTAELLVYRKKTVDRRSSLAGFRWWKLSILVSRAYSPGGSRKTGLHLNALIVGKRSSRRHCLQGDRTMVGEDDGWYDRTRYADEKRGSRRAVCCVKGSSLVTEHCRTAAIKAGDEVNFARKKIRDRRRGVWTQTEGKECCVLRQSDREIKREKLGLLD